MNFLEKLLRAEVIGLVALLICVILMGVYGFLESYVWSLQGKKLLIEPLDAGWLVFKAAGAIGLVVVLFFGAPVYALLSYKHVASWWTVILVGAVPGVGILPFETGLGSWFVICGIVVACITHFLSVKFVSDEPAL